MLHSGYEASAVDYTFSLRGVLPLCARCFPRAIATPKRCNRWRPRSRIRRWCRFPPPSQADIAGHGDCGGGELADGVEQAFDYRGDVTRAVEERDKLEGYIFDRGSSKIRILLKSASKKVTVPVNDIEQLSFTGRDMADGRSWEAWVKKYGERKAAGESNIELVPEAIE